MNIPSARKVGFTRNAQALLWAAVREAVPDFWKLTEPEVASGAGALNQYLEYGFDARMRRTSRRPVAAGRLSPVSALRFGMSLAVIGGPICWSSQVFLPPVSPSSRLRATCLYTLR
jgi:protoheme IX farnesyltransferase